MNHQIPLCTCPCCKESLCKEKHVHGCPSSCHAAHTGQCCSRWDSCELDQTCCNE